jgi:hypothetical protein
VPTAIEPEEVIRALSGRRLPLGPSSQRSSKGSSQGSFMQTTRWREPNKHVVAPPEGSSLEADIGGRNAWIRR